MVNIIAVYDENKKNMNVICGRYRNMSKEAMHVITMVILMTNGDRWKFSEHT
jgi:hypothetical protein